MSFHIVSHIICHTEKLIHKVIDNIGWEPSSTKSNANGKNKISICVTCISVFVSISMIALQLLMFFTVSHKVCQTKMFDKFFGKMFDRPLKKAYQALAKNEPRFAGLEDIKFEKEFTKILQEAKNKFSEGQVNTQSNSSAIKNP